MGEAVRAGLEAVPRNCSFSCGGSRGVVVRRGSVSLSAAVAAGSGRGEGQAFEPFEGGEESVEVGPAPWEAEGESAG